MRTGISVLLHASLLALVAVGPGGCRSPDGTLPPDGATETPREGAVEVTVTVPEEPALPLAVELRGDFGRADRTRLHLARGAVGAYRRVDFVSYVRDLAAFGASGSELTLIPVEANEWIVNSDEELVRIAYRIDTAAAAAAIDDVLVVTQRQPERVVLFGYGLFILAAGTEEWEHVVELRGPERWRVATSLPRRADGRYVAANGFELRDEPILMGASFLSQGIDTPMGRREIHLYSEGDPTPKRALEVLAEEVAASARGLHTLGLPPLERPYHVFFELYDPSPERRLGWALEHGYSFYGTLEKSRLKTFSPRSVYHILHHELHAWVPRRLYSDRLHPERQQNGEPTELIWFAEGFTQYLAFCALASSGAVDPADNLELLARRFGRGYLNDAPPAQPTLCEHSLHLSTRDHEHWFWQFSAGGLLALWIDQQLRSRGDGEAGFAEAMQALYTEWAHHPRGIPEDEFEAAFSRAAGLDLTDFLRRYTRRPHPLPVDGILAGAGIERRGETFEVIPDGAVSEEVRRFRQPVFGRVR